MPDKDLAIGGWVAANTYGRDGESLLQLDRQLVRHTLGHNRKAASLCLGRRGREGGKEGRKEGGKREEGRREGGMEGGGRERGREGERERGREGERGKEVESNELRR